MSRRSSNGSSARDYHESNLIAARAILERPDKYRGALLDWARRILAGQHELVERVAITD